MTAHFVGPSLLALCIFLVAGLPAENAQDSPPKTITINAVESLQYDRVRFAARPGRQIELTLENTSSLSHNLVITVPGARQGILAAANRMGTSGLERDYEYH